MPTALIVGAGIGGLAAGVALRRAGWDIRLVERAPAPREVGFGLALASNAITALRELGVADAVLSQGVTPMAGEIRHPDGRVIRRFTERHAQSVGDRLTVVLRPALHGALLDALDPRVVEVNRPAVRFAHDGARVRLELADGTSAVGDILIGADGVGSTIRAQLHPREAPPRPSGYFAIRGVSPAVKDLGGVQALYYFGRGVESGVVQASSRGIYWFLSLLADDVQAGPIDVESVLRRCTPHFDRQFQNITGATAAHDKRIDELLVREPLRQWGHGPVTLLGDAAHPMLPHTGQGAAQALEDGVALGRAMARNHGHLSALRAYEALRMRRTERVVRMGPRIARLTTTRSPIVTALRNSVIRLMPEGALVKAFTQAGSERRSANS